MISIPITCTHTVMECSEDTDKAKREGEMRIRKEAHASDEFTTNPGINLVVKLRFWIGEAEARQEESIE